VGGISENRARGSRGQHGRRGGATENRAGGGCLSGRDWASGGSGWRTRERGWAYHNQAWVGGRERGFTGPGAVGDGMPHLTGCDIEGDEGNPPHARACGIARTQSSVRSG
jgi:hypothetical protein